jgi:CheY-like chemotaxis protein
MPKYTRALLPKTPLLPQSVHRRVEKGFISTSCTYNREAEQFAPIRRSLDHPGNLKQYDALRDVRILYVDDNSKTSEAVLEVLELTGTRVALAANTAEAMTALETFDPQVIVCALAKPGEGGYVFIRTLREYEQGRSKQIPVLAFTALPSSADRIEAMDAGFQLYLAKPIDIDRLRDSLLQLVDMI